MEERSRTKGEETEHQLKSHAQAVSEFTVNLSEDQQYVFAKIPGFDEDHRADLDILHTVAEWLQEK